jgi:hypothetical protein
MRKHHRAERRGDECRLGGPSRITQEPEIHMEWLGRSRRKR